MGYIYEAMDRAKEQIERNFDYVETRYEAIWRIIDMRWGLQLHTSLHAARYYLNPRFQYDPKFKANLEVKSGLYKVIEKLYPSNEDRIKVDSQLVKFKKAQGMFGINMAIATRDTEQPALWWESYGDECKELQVLAIGILSLTCSATGCERNWSVCDYLHLKRRNRLEQLKLNALVFVKYNLQLEMRQKMREAKGETYDPICLSDTDSDDEWITEKEGACLPDDNTRMDMKECFELEGSGSKKKKEKKRGPRNMSQVGERRNLKEQRKEIEKEEEEFAWTIEEEGEHENSYDEATGDELDD